MSDSDSKSGCSLAEYLQSVCTTRLVPVAQVGQAEMERQSGASKGVRWRDYFSLVAKHAVQGIAYVVLSFTIN